jgi:hypothetical protein
MNGAGTRFTNLASVTGRADYNWGDELGKLSGWLNAGPANSDINTAGHVRWVNSVVVALGVNMTRWSSQFGDIGTCSGFELPTF